MQHCSRVSAPLLHGTMLHQGGIPHLWAWEQNTCGCVANGLAKLAFLELDGGPAPDSVWCALTGPRHIAQADA